MMHKSNMRILLVEDEEINARLLKELLEPKYENITLAFDGIEGIEKFKSDKFDVVISDINMPRCNGINMINELKKINPHIYTILETAHTEASYFIDAINIKVDRFLPKPINAKLLLSYLEEYEIQLSSKKLIQEQQKLLNHYKQVIDDILIVVKTDSKGIIKYVNKKFCETSGYSEIEVIGKKNSQLVSHNQFTNRDLFTQMWENIQNLKPYNMIVRNRTKMGFSYWLESHFYPLTDENNKLVEIIAFSKDITEQLRNEKDKVENIIQQNQENISKAIKISQNKFIEFVPFPTVIINNLHVIEEYNSEFENLILKNSNISFYEQLLDKNLSLSVFCHNIEDLLIQIDATSDIIQLNCGDETFKIKIKSIDSNQTLVSFINV